jgi:hypothetical protein
VYLYSLSHRTYLCIIFSLFLHIYNYAAIDSLVVDGYHEVSGYFGGFDPGDT